MPEPITIRVEQALEKTLLTLGYEIVRVSLSRTRRPLLQIIIERSDFKPITLKDCTKAHHTISHILDVEDPIKWSYRLEVSSPGLDRPLTKIKHFQHFVGHIIKCDIKEMIEDQKKLIGKIHKVVDEDIYLQLSSRHSSEETQTNDILTIPFNQIIRARIMPFYKDQ